MSLQDRFGLRKSTEHEQAAFRVVEMARLAADMERSGNACSGFLYRSMHWVLLKNYVESLGRHAGTTLAQKVAVLASLKILGFSGDTLRDSVFSVAESGFPDDNPHKLTQWATGIPSRVIDGNMHLDHANDLDKLWYENEGAS